MHSETNSDGRCLNLLPPRGSNDEKDKGTQLIAGGEYKIIFQTKEYFDETGRRSFYPWVEVRPHAYARHGAEDLSAQKIPFVVHDPQEHYHIPLLLSPHSYTTYRGS